MAGVFVNPMVSMGGGIEKVYEFSWRDDVKIYDLVSEGYQMLICQEIRVSGGYKYAQSAVVWFDSNAKEEYAPNVGDYKTTWYTPYSYKGSSLGSIGTNYFEITDSGTITYGNLDDNSLFVRFTAIKFKMTQ